MSKVVQSHRSRQSGLTPTLVQHCLMLESWTSSSLLATKSLVWKGEGRGGKEKGADLCFFAFFIYFFCDFLRLFYLNPSESAPTELFALQEYAPPSEVVTASMDSSRVYVCNGGGVGEGVAEAGRRGRRKNNINVLLKTTINSKLAQSILLDTPTRCQYSAPLGSGLPDIGLRKKALANSANKPRFLTACSPGPPNNLPKFSFF